MTDLEARSEAIGYRKATKRRMEIPSNGMKVRAVNGPHRGHWFHFYPSVGSVIEVGWPFNGVYQDTVAIDRGGIIAVYRLIQSEDPRRWVLRYDPIASITETSDK